MLHGKQHLLFLSGADSGAAACLTAFIQLHHVRVRH
jgi:hypothetical protein